MAHHIRRLHNRQGPDDTPPVADGLDGASVAGVDHQTANIANTLVLDDGGKGGAPTGVELSIAATSTTPSQPTGDLSNNSNNDPSTTPAPSSGAADISMGTVIGACLGALAGAVALILIGLWLYKRGTARPKRRPSDAHKGERAWGKLDEDHEDKWEAKGDAESKYQKQGVVSVGPMEKLTMFKNSTPSVRTNYTHTQEYDQEPLPAVAQFDHPFAQYHPNLAKELAEDNADLNEPPRRPFLARVNPITPISWDGDTVGRDSFLSLNSINNPISPGTDLAIRTPGLTSSEPHMWESAEVVQFNQDTAARVEAPAAAAAAPEPRRKSSNNPFFGSRMSTHSVASQSRSRTPSLSAGSKPTIPDMPAPPPPAFTYEEKGKAREVTPPSPTTPTAITNPFLDVVVPEFKVHHSNHSSHDRALASLIAALGPAATTQEDVEERLRVASMNPSVASAYTETDFGDDATIRQSWPVPPSRPSPDDF
ncbi:hypothetical protein C8J57DRAFT_1170070 [Mycena rebaudengoi]|nr:hypothetical protein C8J57DRAFT_1170070 [Mycena rebaudengoi]